MTHGSRSPAASRTVVLNIVGLTESLLGPRLPRLHAFRQRGGLHRIQPAFPAVTCTAQSDYLTGRSPAQHGIVANGWYDRDLAEVLFWRQSNHLVHGPKLWEELRQRIPGFTCAKLFWWFNMYSTADYSITPRPIYPADGRKFFDIHTWPYAIRPAIKRDLGEFPFPTFWGPVAGLPSRFGPPEAATLWIAEAARWIEHRHQPTLSLVYLPHLDYNLQRLGPDHPAIDQDLAIIDRIAGDLIDFFDSRGVQPLVLSEYGLTPVDQPVHLNRLFRERGWLALKDELGLERLDCGACRAFAVADHQVAHIYLNDPTLQNEVRHALETLPGIAQVLGHAQKAAAGLDHPRAGDLIAVAQPNAWFTYYYWLDDRRAPDFARCVDIHRKPGYDPVELFFDPDKRALALQILWRVARSKLGFRTLMDVIPLDATLVRGSHGARPADPRHWPILLPGRPIWAQSDTLPSTSVSSVIRAAVLSGSA